mmetsp:Transcript_38702/g.70475  ORF Transcript_38702/g.70475 Transcript_38702/m.70475 type:complete len:329 (+) Transcript_38702:96-1082(+)
MVVWGRGKGKTSAIVKSAKKTSCIGGHNAEEIDAINTLHGIMSALSLAFVFGVQYMIGPQDATDFADYRSLICKNEDFRLYVAELLSWYDIGTHEPETFNFTVHIGKGGETFDVKQELLTGITERHGNSINGDNHMKCLRDKYVQATVALTANEFPMSHLRAFILVNGDAGENSPGTYRWSRYNEVYSSISSALIFTGLLWSIILNLSLALAPVREDTSGTALVSWLFIGGPTMVINYLFLVTGLILFFVTNGRQLLGTSPYVHATEDSTVTLALFNLMLPLFFVGLVLGVAAGVWSTCNVPMSTEDADESGKQAAAPDAPAENTTDL